MQNNKYKITYHLISTTLNNLFPFPSFKHSIIMTTFSASSNSS